MGLRIFAYCVKFAGVHPADLFLLHKVSFVGKLFTLNILSFLPRWSSLHTEK